MVPRQVHGAYVTVVRAPDQETQEAGCDGLTTDRTGILLGVLGADCPGVLLVAPVQRALAVVHAGWRGVAANIVPAAVSLLVQTYDVRADGILAGIGPGISAARYEVSDAVAAGIRAAIPVTAHSHVVRPGRPGHAHVDLGAALRAQLMASGVPPGSIEVHPSCTFEDPRFFSHRRDAGVTGRHALVAGWLR